MAVSRGRQAVADDVASARVHHLEIAGHRLAVLSLPALGHAPGLLRLTTAEREVASMLLAGLSQSRIATRRGTSPRTVANQVAAIYRKLDVGSRAELAAAVANRREGAGQKGGKDGTG